MTQAQVSTQSGVRYQFTEPSSDSSLVELFSGSTYRLSGFASTPETTLALGSSDYIILAAGIVHTDVGSATSVQDSEAWVSGYVQSTIWTVDDSGKLSVHWVNPDGSVHPQYVYLSNRYLYVTGDPVLLEEEIGDDALGQPLGTLTAVDLYFQE
ncbi:hypothetical protein BD414DRAFT_540149 [Trametes punicea]|nr:hypothetical protein BD414DRAFT_540149 [Trametes punicea]